MVLSVVCASAMQAQESRVFGVTPGSLARAKAKLAAGDKSLRPAYDKLVSDAERALKQKPLSVMEKPKVPPGFDKHDYFSTAPYFWPDPTKPDGLPYIRKDGQRNPESHNEASDSSRLGKMCGTAETLALSFYFSGNESHAAHAAKLLRVWFIDPGTRMNPNFDHAQAVPGVNSGRGTGMIESRSLRAACDAVALLRSSKEWSKADDDTFTNWMRAFLDWAQTSKNGRDDAAAANNHGTFYDTQVAHFALFLGETNLARKIVEESKTKRLAKQIEPDGRQPRELAREDSFGYSRFNVQAWFDLAELGEHVGVDLWHYDAPNGASIRKALDYLVTFVEQPDKPWPFEHSKKANRSLAGLPRRACAAYHDARYCKLAGPEANSQRDALFYPAH